MISLPFKVVVASGYFAALHRGHLLYLHEAAKLGDILIVVVNSDLQTKLKGSTPFMNERDRLDIVRSLRCVDMAYLAIDEDRSISRTIEMLHPLFRVAIFANGGDVRSEADCREAETCRRLGIEMAFGVGGFEKCASSSELIRRAALLT